MALSSRGRLRANEETQKESLRLEQQRNESCSVRSTQTKSGLTQNSRRRWFQQTIPLAALLVGCVFGLLYTGSSPKGGKRFLPRSHHQDSMVGTVSSPEIQAPHHTEGKAHARGRKTRRGRKKMTQGRKTLREGATRPASAGGVVVKHEENWNVRHQQTTTTKSGNETMISFFPVSKVVVLSLSLSFGPI